MDFPYKKLHRVFWKPVQQSPYQSGTSSSAGCIKPVFISPPQRAALLPITGGRCQLSACVLLPHTNSLPVHFHFNSPVGLFYSSCNLGVHISNCLLLPLRKAFFSSEVQPVWLSGFSWGHLSAMSRTAELHLFYCEGSQQRAGNHATRRHQFYIFWQGKPLSKLDVKPGSIGVKLVAG